MAVSRKFLALNDPDPKNMTVIEHLEELRRRLLVCVIVAAVAAVVSAVFLYGPMNDLLTHPLLGIKNTLDPGKVFTTDLTGAFFLRIKLALLPAAFISLPVWLYELWMFIAPAFEVETRRFTVPFVGLGMVLFLIGAFIGYLVFPRYLGFMTSIGGSNLIYIPDANRLLNQYALLVLMFGGVFELPIVLSMLARVGILSSVFLRRKRKIAVFASLFAGMIITPGADFITPLIVGGLLIILYEFSIVLIRFQHR